MLKLRVCIGSSCHMKGSYNVIQIFQQVIEENKLHDYIDFSATFCMKRCQNTGIAVTVDEEPYGVTPENARHFFKSAIIPMIDK